MAGGSVWRADHVDRPVFAANAAGAVVWAQAYDPFRRVVSGLGSDARFAGQWFAAENGLHQNWMRDYDATLGRYIQADPLGLIDGASVYGYVGSNPAMFSDPTGQCPWCAAVLVGALAGVATGYALEEAIGDGCYTWADAGRDAAIGAALGPLGKAIGLADDTARMVPSFGAAASKAVATGSRRGGESVATAAGRAAHRAKQYPPGFRTEQALASGRRVDAMNRASREIIELKPNTASGQRQGARQLKGYLDELNSNLEPGEKPWTGWVEHY